MRSRNPRARLARTVRLCAVVIPTLLACSDPPTAGNNPTGALSVSIDGTGLDFPQLITIKVNSNIFGVRPNQRAFLSALPPGTYTVSLDALPGNCTAAKTSETVKVERGNATTIRFVVTCVALYGALRIEVITNGPDPDQTGYHLQLSNGNAYETGATGTYVFLPIPGGSQTITLESIAANCSAVSPVTQAFTVTLGATTRDTAKVTFTLACSKVEKFAFRRSTVTNNVAFHAVTLSYADGSEVAGVGNGYAPSWSPNGASLAYSFLDCSYQYYYSFFFPCYQVGLAAMDAQTRNVIILTKDPNDADPAWSPNGAVIAFERSGALYFVGPTTANGTVTRLTLPTSVRQARQPSWSPDAKTLAFSCVMEDGWTDICSIAVDGSSFVRLTNDAVIDVNPEWSPDGSRIAFSTSTSSADAEIAVMASTGGAITKLTTGKNPAWTPDGQKILFERVTGPNGISMLVLASGAVKQLTTGDDHDPAWRP